MAANTVITAHVVVDFGSDSSANIIVEVDDRPEGLNAGKTSFAPGDNVGLLVFMPTGYTVDSVYTTAGTLTALSAITKDVEEMISFPNEDSASVNYPMNNSVSLSWVGTPPSGTTMSKSGENSISLSPRQLDAQGKPTPKYRIGIGKAVYSSTGRAYRLSNVPLTVASVMCFFVCKKV